MPGSMIMIIELIKSIKPKIPLSPPSRASRLAQGSACALAPFLTESRGNPHDDQSPGGCNPCPPGTALPNESRRVGQRDGHTSRLESPALPLARCQAQRRFQQQADDTPDYLFGTVACRAPRDLPEIQDRRNACHESAEQRFHRKTPWPLIFAAPLSTLEPWLTSGSETVETVSTACAFQSGFRRGGCIPRQHPSPSPWCVQPPFVA